MQIINLGWYVLQYKANTKANPCHLPRDEGAGRVRWGDTKFNWRANILTVLPGNQGGGRAGGLPPLIATQQPLGPRCLTRLPALGILERLLRHLSLSTVSPFPVT